MSIYYFQNANMSCEQKTRKEKFGVLRIGPKSEVPQQCTGDLVEEQEQSEWTTAL